MSMKKFHLKHNFPCKPELLHFENDLTTENLKNFPKILKRNILAKKLNLHSACYPILSAIQVGWKCQTNSSIVMREHPPSGCVLLRCQRLRLTARARTPFWRFCEWKIFIKVAKRCRKSREKTSLKRFCIRKWPMEKVRGAIAEVKILPLTSESFMTAGFMADVPEMRVARSSWRETAMSSHSWSDS